MTARTSIATLVVLFSGCAAEPLPTDVSEWATFAPAAQQAPPGTLEISAPQFLLGEINEIEITGGGALDSALMMRGTGGIGAGPCPALLGGLCLDLALPVVFAGGVALDAAGEGTYTLAIPATPGLVGRELCFQAAIADGPDSELSNTVCYDLDFDSDGDGVLDSDDICPLGDDSVDTDGDGVPDACEETETSDPTVMIYSNYDGGTFTIDVDADQPNIHIGLNSYIDMDVEITGAFVDNVSKVVYAGYNDHGGTAITGVDPSLVEILVAPPATFDDPVGYPSIICNYSGGTGYQGGCNTVVQVDHFFLTSFGGTIDFHLCQYGAFSGTLATSAGGLCI